MKKQQFLWTADKGWSGFDTTDFNPGLVLFFGSTPIMAERSVHNELRERFPDAIILGCSGGGQIHADGIVDDGVTGVAIEFAHTRIKLQTAPAMDSFDSFTMGRSLGIALDAKDLAGVLLLTDGLEVNGDELLSGMNASFGRSVVIGGGMAADDDRFVKTLISANGQASANTIAAIGFYGDKVKLTSSRGDGWKPAGVEFEITASRMNKLYDLNGSPALDLYESNLGSNAA